MSKRISFGVMRRAANVLVDFFHNKPAAEIELTKAEALLKRAEAEYKRAKAKDILGDAKLKEARRKYINVKKYILLNEYLKVMGLTEEEKGEFILQSGPEHQEALNDIHELLSKGRVIALKTD